MKHAHQAQFGRLTPAVHSKDEPSGMTDKWDILAALTEAADEYGLNHRTLGVLKVLMTFLPERMIRPDPCGAIVFPSNRTLSKRLNGMPDSTLRRHLATLVTIGIVSRHDSANRKRFAKRVGNIRELAFGFDLSPLARQAADISQCAARAVQHREHLSAMRACVARLRQQVLGRYGDQDLTQEAFRVLRRKPNETDLRHVQHALEACINAVPAEETSGTNVQNERHIQYENINLSISDGDNLAEEVSISVPVSGGACEGVPSQNPLCLHEVTQVCKEYKSYFPEPVRRWRDLAHIADRLTPMMGIDSDVFKDAIQKMGLASAATAVLCILDRLGDIGNPGGYLRRLAQNAQGGRFDIRPLLNIIRGKHELSPDNLKYA